MNSVLRNLVVWFVLGSLLIYVFNNIENTGAREQISYSQFKEEVLSDRIAKVVYKGDQMTIIGDRLEVLSLKQHTQYLKKMKPLIMLLKIMV